MLTGSILNDSLCLSAICQLDFNSPSPTASFQQFAASPPSPGSPRKVKVFPCPADTNYSRQGPKVPVTNSTPFPLPAAAASPARQPLGPRLPRLLPGSFSGFSLPLSPFAHTPASPRSARRAVAPGATSPVHGVGVTPARGQPPSRGRVCVCVCETGRRLSWESCPPRQWPGRPRVIPGRSADSRRLSKFPA